MGIADFVHDSRVGARYTKTYGLTHEQLAMVSVVQREWTARNPRTTFKTPITVEDVLHSRMIAYPFRLFQCCLVTDGGDALNPGLRRARPRLPAETGLSDRHRRECRDADGEPNGGFHLLARLPRRRRQDLGLPRRRRHVRRLGNHHYVERVAMRSGF